MTSQAQNIKYALVTGGSRGIGKAISIDLAKDGYHVLVNYRSNHKEAKDTLNLIVGNGGSGELLPFNVSNAEEVKSVLGKWLDENTDKHIEVLVNNAGITHDDIMVFMTDDKWNDVIDANLNSFFYVTRQLLQNMIVQKNGRIINVVSLSGQKGHPGQVNYAAAKAGVIAATKSLAMEIGKKKVRVNAVAPGFIRTDMTEGLNEQDLKKLIPLNRFGTPEEVSGAVSFLASEKASYITGEVISINGGIYS